MLGAMLLFVLTGCSSLRHTRNAPTTTPERKDIPQVYNPSTGKYEPVDHPAELVDTIHFTEDKSIEPATSVTDPVSTKKAVYELAFLMPFQADHSIDLTEGADPRLRRFLHYYGGAKLALADLAKRGIHLDVHVYDCGESAAATRRILQDLKEPDAIIGPYDIESLREAAAYGDRHHVPVFSPWTPGIPMETDNEFFVQLNPGLEAHAEAIVRYIEEHLSGARIFLVARNDPRERGRLSLFQDAHRTGRRELLLEELIIEDVSADLNNTSLEELLAQDEVTAFIVPLYSRNDEDFINAFIRKLHAEKGEAVVYVFGLPQWLTFNRLNPDYMENTNVHVSAVSYVDPADPAIYPLQERFLDIYGTIPEPAAHHAYAFVSYLGEALDLYGNQFLDEISMQHGPGPFDIVPVYRSKGVEQRNAIQCFENRAIEILRFVEHAFHKVE